MLNLLFLKEEKKNSEGSSCFLKEQLIVAWIHEQYVVPSRDNFYLEELATIYGSTKLPIVPLRKTLFLVTTTIVHSNENIFSRSDQLFLSPLEVLVPSSNTGPEHWR